MLSEKLCECNGLSSTFLFIFEGSGVDEVKIYVFKLTLIVKTQESPLLYKQHFHDSQVTSHKL